MAARKPTSAAARRLVPVVLAVAACLAVAPGCGSDTCGPGDAPADGITGTIGADTVTYGQLTSSPNNDCNAPGAGISLTLDGVQTGPSETGLHLTFCLPRPGDLGTGPVSLTDANLVEIVDVFARTDDCITQLDRTAPATGTMEFLGYCDGGTNSAGYAIRLSGAVPATRTCPGDAGAPESVTVQLSGTAAVTAL